MSIYQQAAKKKLRFSTEKGSLSVEQLYDLTMASLARTIREVKKLLKKNDEDDLSFLDSTKVVDADNELRFEILKDVYLSRQKEAENATNARAVKEHNERIDTLIEKKKEEELSSMSIEELNKLRK